jgi:N-acetylated-alpha-linked acidic dipeptidase
MQPRPIVTLLLATASFAAAAEPQPSPVPGFTAASSPAQVERERAYRAGIVADTIRENMRRLSARPHHVGSPYGKDNAEWMLARFKEWGFDARIESFEVLFPTPKVRVVELLQPTRFVAKLEEPVLAIDPTSDQRAEQLPTYNAYSADGDVTAALVYVNFGNREDYDELARLGISVKGKIVIARYGGGWRGIKPKVAAEHGAIGCIIYSDPRNDGFFQGDDYPAGGWRPRHGVQRGSVMDTDYPGDPLTPGVAATADAKRLAIKDAKTITRIPVLPISAADALPLLSALAGPVAPREWRGALATTYHVGPGPATVHLAVTSHWDLKPLYNVIATLPGADPSQWVIRGNHHDAWVNGAEDPVSGMAPMLEEARMLGELHRRGWTPRRSLIYCAWDGEEPGLLGSVEWVEAHLAELRQHAVAYINSDSNERGFLSSGGTQDLQAFVSDVARDVEDPETRLSVFERARLKGIADAGNARERGALRQRRDLVLEALGDGSDFTAFQDLAGVSTLSLEFGGEEQGTQYHSIYDDFYWYTHFGDPEFAYGKALAQTVGTAVLRLADADLIPFDYAAQAEAIAGYAEELETLLKDKQEEFTELDLQLKEGVFAAIADPRRPSTTPPAERVPPYMNFAPMENAIEQLKGSSERYSKALAAWTAQGSPALPAPALASVNGRLLQVSRLFLDERGLPERPWFKNQIYAPGAYTGYGAKPIAAVREYMDQKKWEEAEGQVPRVAAAIAKAAAGIEAAADALAAAVGPAPQ